MISSHNAIALVFGVLINASVLATYSIDDRNASEEVAARTAFQQDLIDRLEGERSLKDKLSRRSTELLVEYREDLLFQGSRQIVEMMTSPDHPYKKNTDEIFQCQQRIHGLEDQLLEMGYREEYVYILLSFPKPNINRFGGGPPYTQEYNLKCVSMKGESR